MSNLSRKRAYSEVSSKSSSSSSSSSDDMPEEEPAKLISDEEIIERLDLLDSVTRRKLLMQAAQSHLDVLQAVKTETPLCEHARSSTLHFDKFANAVYKLTNCPSYKYDDYRLPAAFEASQVDRVVSKISRYLKTIDKNTHQDASFATRQNALVTLGDMCRHLIDANTPVAEVVITSFDEDLSPASVMWKIVRDFAKEEIRLLKRRAIGKKWLLETKRMTHQIRYSEPFRRLSWVVARMGGADFYWQFEVERQKHEKESAQKHRNERARLRKRSRISN